MEDVSRGAPANFMVLGMKRMSMTCVGGAGRPGSYWQQAAIAADPALP